MTGSVRPATAGDAVMMAQVHVRSWQETYRGLMRDAVLDDPGLVEARERFWTAMLTDPRFEGNRAAVAQRADGAVVGIALAGPSLENDAPCPLQLYVLYLLGAEHGTGLGADLLRAVLAPDEEAMLWVADPNPRAQAFYRRQGFRPDGTEKVDDAVREIRLVRSPRPRDPLA